MDQVCATPCPQEARIRVLEAGQVEAQVYLKVIREDVAEIKQTLKPSTDEKKSTWQPIMIELIKLVTLAVLILGGMAGVTKLIK